MLEPIELASRHAPGVRRLLGAALPGAEQFQHVTNQRRGQSPDQLRMTFFIRR